MPLDIQPQALGDRTRDCDIGVGHHDDEFLTAETGHHVENAQITGDPSSQFPQHRIADGVAMAVIDLLEEVDVEDDQRQRYFQDR